jgi:hypothetical protein
MHTARVSLALLVVGAVTLTGAPAWADVPAQGLGTASEWSYGRGDDGSVERRRSEHRDEALPAAADLPAGEAFCVWVEQGVGGTVPATLALTLGTPASFGAFQPGVGEDYRASVLANVISTAGDAALSVADPSPTATGRLVNGSFALASKLQARAYSLAQQGRALAEVGGAGAPTGLLEWDRPVSNDAVTVEFGQRIAATDPLRTGSYSKTLTFTLSTTNP